MSERRRADHVGYVRAVVGDLRILDVEIDRLADLATESPLGGVGQYTTGFAKRASGLYVRDCYRWPWHEYYRWTADVLWDEEFGWAMTKSFEINASPDRGRVYGCYSLGLGLVPDPSDVALRVASALMTGDGPGDRPRQLRSAGNYSWPFESALAAHLST